jgi:metal-sulfur cluster biosynthetic enzyme
MGQSVVVSKTDLRAALENVMDPHFNVTLREMGMLRSVEADAEGYVKVGIVFPCIGCPAWEMIQGEIRSQVKKVEGVSRVKVRVLWEDWDRSDMSDAARAHAQAHGYVI